MRDTNDADLTELLQRLRNEDERRAPEFRILWDRALSEASESDLGLQSGGRHRWGVPRSLRWAGPLLAAAATVVLLLVSVRSTSDAEFVRAVEDFSADPAGGAWQSPTDALLRFTGESILSTVPTIRSPRWLPGLGSAPSGNGL